MHQIAVRVAFPLPNTFMSALSGSFARPPQRLLRETHFRLWSVRGKIHLKFLNLHGFSFPCLTTWRLVHHVFLVAGAFLFSLTLRLKGAPNHRNR
jgi:hypothetical protein